MAMDFLSMTYNERIKLLKDLGQPQFRVKQIEEWMFTRFVLDYMEMTNLPLTLREQLRNTGVPLIPASLKARHNTPAAAKFVVELADLQLVESVIMFYHHGASLCVSSQVGCKMSCGFCASGQGGYKRNLSSLEMAAQLLLANSLLRERNQKITHIVMMGMGEPLDNYEETIGFLRMVTSAPLAISPRRITVSTCGLVPQIERLALEGLPITLSVSLHAPNDEIRQQIMPIGKKYTYNQVLQAMHLYQEKSGRRVSIEYTLIKGLNDSEKHAIELASKIKGSDFHVNLIPVNPVEGAGWERPTLQRVRRFRDVLMAAGINTTIRRELGTEVSGSCGQLRRSLLDKR